MSGQAVVPEAQPSALYKYRAWDADSPQNYQARLLTHKEIFFASPARFNDPFDCYISLSARAGNAAETRKALVQAVKDDPCLSQLPRKERERFITERVVELGNPAKVKEEQNLELQDRVHNFGVFSLAGTKESLVMWAHYAHSHKGLCVGLDSNVLECVIQDLYDTKEIPGERYLVDYVDEYPILNLLGPKRIRPGSSMNVALTTKSRHWEYENEYRLIVCGCTDLQVSLPEEAFACVVLGCRMPEQDKNAICEILKGWTRKVNVLQATPADDRFALVFQEVHY